MELLEWTGFFLSFLASFLCSLFHFSLGSFSKISLIRFLEDKDKQDRHRILELYDDIKTSVEFTRFLFFTAFLVYLFGVFPRLKFWPLWLFLISLAVYFIFFDFLPRFFNSLNKKKVFGFLLPSYRLFHFLASPLLFVVKVTPAPKDKEQLREASEEEIQTFIDEAREEGILGKGEGAFIKSVVEFSDAFVGEIMTPRIDMICIRKDATIEKLRELVLKEKHSRIPVYKDRMDNIEGLVIAKDLLAYSADEFKAKPIEPLIRPVYFVPESMRASRLLKEFQKRKQKLAIVIDEHGGVSGMVTMEDLVEEIIGDILDEYDTEVARISEKGLFDYIVSGDVEVEEIEERMKLDFAEDDYITIGGFITHHLGRLPEQGEHLHIKGLDLEILEVDQKRIKKLRVKKTS